MWLAGGAAAAVAAAAVVAAVAAVVVGMQFRCYFHCCYIVAVVLLPDLCWTSPTRIFVAVVAAVDVLVAVAAVVAAVHFQGWIVTVVSSEISSTDEILFPLLRQQVGAEIWSSTCCIGQPAWPKGYHAGQGDPETGREKQTDN